MGDKQEENQIQTAVRLPESWIERIDKLAESMSEPGRPATRAGALRSALYRGIVEIEKENKKR
jgi:predicted DNA-binding protein